MKSEDAAVGRPPLLSGAFRVAVATMLAFGLFMQVLLIVGVYLAERTLDRGVAPMQEMLQIQRQGALALQLLKRPDARREAICTLEEQDDICGLPLLLRNIDAAAQRLLDGTGGLAGLPPSRPLEGDARALAQVLRDIVRPLLPLSTAQALSEGDHLLTLQQGLLQVDHQAHQLEQQVLAQMQADFRFKHWLDLLAIAATGILMAATVFTLFWMWWRVREGFDQLRTSEARLRAYTDAVPDIAYVLDAGGRVLEIMGNARQSQDRPLSIPVGDRLQEHRPAHLVSQYMQTIRNALVTREVQTLEVEVPDQRGDSHWFEARVAVIERPIDANATAQPPAPDGGADQVIWLSRDVTSRIRTEQQLRQLNDELEQRVAERTRELNDAADELRRFNYTVSHDLRAPLRAVEAYTALAVEEAGETLNASARDLLERSRKSASQLSHMVESLLQLSRLGEIPLQCTWLDLSAMTSEIAMAFALDQKERRIEWTIESGLQAWADEHLMRSVLQNLVSNAVKYSAHRDPAVIDFGQLAQPDGTQAFFVRDNGAGFDMAQASQLFQPFTRLHSAREFSGDGIGLATVRRIIIRHGGRIWAQGQVDAGATIFFTLPGPTTTRERDFSGSRPAPLEAGSSRPAPLWPDIET